MKQRTRLMHSGDDLISYHMSKKTDGDVNGEIQLHRMRPQEHFIEAQVQEGDTLQAISLRFHCSVSELKRINQIHKDNEIFARRTVKIPVTPFSVLTELIPSSQPPAVSPPSNCTPIILNPSIQELLDNTHNAVVLPVNNNAESKDDFAINCNAVVLNSTLAPATIPYTDIEPNDPVSEDTKLLPSKYKEPVESVVVKQLTSQGADFGLKWYHLLGCILLLGVVVPLIYVMFYLDTHPKHNSTHIPNTYGSD